MIHKPENVDLVIKDAATAKEMVVEGVEYVHKTCLLYTSPSPRD